MNTENPTILIIDDEKGLREGSKRLLMNEGYIVDTAENGATGILLVKDNEYDLVIIDLKMPDIDGLDVLTEIKRLRPNSVCFIATAYASYETAVESTRLGAYSYIPKPFTPEELIFNLEKGLKHRQLLLEAERLKREREESLLEVAHEKSRLKTIIESISSGVLLVNTGGEVVYYNHATLNKLAIDDLQIGQYSLDKLPDGLTDIVTRMLSEKKTVNKSFTTQYEINNGDMYIDATCSPVPQHDGTVAGVVIVLKNITGFKKIEKIKNQFVSMVAHELKTPLAAVLGYIRIMQDESIHISESQQDEFLTRSRSRLNSLLDLVNDLLDISRMEEKKVGREIEELDIKEIIRNTIKFLEFEIAKSKLLVNINFPDQLPVIKADRNEIIRVFTNIISNAIKYNKEKGFIDIDCSENGNYLTIKVSDSGIGMQPEEKEKLFQEFFRAKNKYTREITGTGLGLSIVKKIIESYHGKVEVESVFEKGSTFIVHLPINK